MKSPGIVSVPVFAGVVMFCALGPVFAQEGSVWMADKARETSSGLLVRDSGGSYDMEVADRAGISIGEKPDVGSDGKSLVFTGEHQLVLRTVTPFSPPTTSLKVSVDVKPGEASNSHYEKVT